MDIFTLQSAQAYTDEKIKEAAEMTGEGVEKIVKDTVGAEVNEYLAESGFNDIKNELYETGLNKINPNNIISGKTIYGWNGGQTVDNPYRNAANKAVFGVIELQNDTAYVFSYDLGAVNVQILADVYNSDGTYARTAQFSRSKVITLAGEEKYIVASLNIADYPILGTEQIIPQSEDVTVYHSSSNSSKLDAIKKEITKENEEQRKYIEDTKEAIYRNSLSNPFVYATPDNGYITFVFDDGRHDLDLVASIFESYNIPLSVAIPPDTLSNVCDGLTETVGSYTVGMTIKEVCEKIVELGGEVLAHSWTPATTDNYKDFSFMYEKFATVKETLESAGFCIRGIMLAGGTGCVYGSDNEVLGKEFQKWSMMYYDYSDGYGITEDYGKKRINMNADLDTLKNKIDTTVTDKKWLSFFCHTLDGTEKNLTKDNLSELLQYCIDSGIKAVTYATFYDKFRSTKIEELVKTI